MVELVAEMKKTNPQICDPVLDAIERSHLSAMHYMTDAQKLGELMNMNHALLEVLGVGHPGSPVWCLRHGLQGRTGQNSPERAAAAA